MNWAFFRSPDTGYWKLGNSQYLWYQRELEISVPETSIKLLNGQCCSQVPWKVCDIFVLTFLTHSSFNEVATTRWACSSRKPCLSIRFFRGYVLSPRRHEGAQWDSCAPSSQASQTRSRRCETAPVHEAQHPDSGRSRCSGVKLSQAFPASSSP